jgi:hypothetical protein
LAQGEEEGVGVRVHANRGSSHPASLHNACVISTPSTLPSLYDADRRFEGAGGCSISLAAMSDMCVDPVRGEVQRVVRPVSADHRASVGSRWIPTDCD